MLIAATLQATGGAGGAIWELNGGAEDSLMRERQLTQSARVEILPNIALDFPSKI